MTKDIEIPVDQCPECGYVIEVTSGICNNATKPRTGDISMCLGCGHLTLFNKDMTLREPSKEEALTISLMPEIIQAQLARAHIVGDKLAKKL